MARRRIKLTIDEKVLERYEEYYFQLHPKAHKRPIPHPYHESINTWMIMKRPMMNGLKQKWKDFIKWYIDDLGYTNLHILECDITQKVFYATNRPHDVDNSTPKFILDGFVESGFLISDDCRCIQKLTLQVSTDKEHPRTEFYVNARSVEEKENVAVLPQESELQEEEKENNSDAKKEENN